MSFIVEAQALAKQYPHRPEPAVKGVSFGVLPGEVFSLLGPNGAGKTTTLSMLSCLLQPSGGEARIAGHSVKTQADAVKRAIGVVPQDIALYPTLSATENLNFWGQMYGLGGADLKKRVDEVLETVGLRDRAKDRIDTYSGGMKRRINIAVGLLHKPKVVFMDEPTVGIDPQSRRNILDMVKALNAQGMTVLYTTHYMEEAEELSHRIGIIDHGQLIALGTQEELTHLVGHEDVIELTLAVEPVPAELLAAFRQVRDVKQVTAEGNVVRALAPASSLVLPDLFAALAAHGVKLAGLSIREPNLEAVFLHLTGRALRD